MLIRECLAEDIPRLEQVGPTGVNAWHRVRFDKQQAGLGTYLVALLDDVPVGHGLIHWPGCPGRDPHLDEHHPDCPEINGLHVYRRNQGVGTRLIRSAEEHARRRGFVRIGMAVADDNPDAARLYERLGYEARSTYSGSYTYVDQDGVEHEVVEHCTFMVLEL